MMIRHLRRPRHIGLSRPEDAPEVVLRALATIPETPEDIGTIQEAPEDIERIPETPEDLITRKARKRSIEDARRALPAHLENLEILEDVVTILQLHLLQGSQ